MGCFGGSYRCITNNIAGMSVDQNGTIIGSDQALDIMAYESIVNVQNETRLGNESWAQTILSLAQMALYYTMANDMVDKRDDKIDDQLDFIDELETYTETQDLPMLQLKRQVVTDLTIPIADVCAESDRYLTESMQDGEAIVETCDRLSKQSCAGIPSGWGIHEGELMGAMAGPYASNILSGNAKRREP